MRAAASAASRILNDFFTAARGTIWCFRKKIHHLLVLVRVSCTPTSRIISNMLQTGNCMTNEKLNTSSCITSSKILDLFTGGFVVPVVVEATHVRCTESPQGSPLTAGTREGRLQRKCQRQIQRQWQLEQHGHRRGAGATWVKG